MKPSAGLRHALMGAVIAIGGLSQPVQAAEKSFSLTSGALSAIGDSTQSNTLILNNAPDPGFVMHFTLPEDFAPDTAFRITLTLHAVTPSPSFACSAVVEGISLTRRRPNSVVASGTADIAPVSGSNRVNFPGNGITVNKLYLVNPPAAGGPLVGQRARDQFTISFKRRTALTADNCPGPVSVHVVTVRYTVAAP